jgi:phosphoribosylformimino-5-aminoimidazole carboxamide ribotide isomerase
MLIVPAIDLAAGSCVRLFQGRFDQTTDYGEPGARLRAFAEAGAAWVHIVDLDGARARRPVQQALITQLAQSGPSKLQCGGGVRTLNDVEILLQAGAARVVVGSVAARNPAAVRGWIDAVGVDRLCIAIDVRETSVGWEVQADGWTAGAGTSLPALLATYPLGSVRHVLVTDISRDGALAGPNLALYRTILEARPDLVLQASGGVSRLSDLSALRQIGAHAAIVGRALYEQRFSLEEALAL